MKFWFIVISIFCFGAHSWSQHTWSKLSEVNPNPEFTNPMGKMDWLLINNKGYHIYDSASSYIKLSVYKPETSSWQLLGIENIGTTFSDLRSYHINNKIYTVVLTFDGIIIYEYDLATNDFIQVANNTGSFFALSSNVSTAFSAVSNMIYITVVDNGTTISLLSYSISAQSLSAPVNINSTINPSNFSVFGRIPMYTSNASLYVGLAAPSFRLGLSPLTNISSFGPYNTAGSNNAILKYNGNAIVNGTYLLSGNGQNAPNVIYTETSSSLTYSKPVTTSDINFVAGTDTPLTWNTGNSDNTVLSSPAYEFVLSEFSDQSQSTMDKFYVYRKDVSTGVWDSIGPKVEFTSPYLNANSARMSLENVNSLHLGIMYRSTSSNGGAKYAVLNQRPVLNPSSVVANSGLCINNQNIIYPELIFYDDDRELVRIISVSSTNGLIGNAVAIPVGYDNSAVPSLSKFIIKGFPSATGSTQLIVTYTDGWNTFTDTLPAITIGASVPTVTFVPAAPVFCSNENLLDLSNYVSYFDNGGSFKINGQELSTTTSSAAITQNFGASGVIQYSVPINGCIVSTSAGYFVATVGTATGTSTPATCGQTDGTASVVYTAGTGSIASVEWTTGEITSSINNLSPGAYYYNVTDTYGCHVTGFTNVETVSIDVAPTVTQISCNGAKDGSISVAISGPSNFSTVWSNGYSNASISNLAPGTYWLTVTDLSNGCHSTSEYTIVEPAPIVANFTTYDPDCGVANGVVYGTYSGGSGTLTYSWLGMGQTTPDLISVPYGFYQVEVTDGLGCKDTFDYQLNDYQSMSIAEQVTNASCLENDGAIFVNLTDNGAALKEINWSNGASTPSNFNLFSGDYTITVKSGPSPFNGNTCYSVKTIHVGQVKPSKQEICLVSVDTSTTTNLVIWEKIDTTNIAYYNIYRENTVAGEFVLIDTVDVSNLSVFNDVVASPLDKSWRYKLSAVDVCGTESPISATHKTLHLNTIDVQANGSVDIFWDDYEGNNSGASYVVWRYTDASGWQALSPQVPIGTSYFNETPPQNATGLDYYVEMVLDFPCTATKAQDFNATRSNRDKGAFAAGNGTGNSSNGIEEWSNFISVYPNPANSTVTLWIDDSRVGQQLELISTQGQVLNVVEVNDVQTTLDVSGLTAGMYYLKWKTNGTLYPLMKQ